MSRRIVFSRSTVRDLRNIPDRVLLKRLSGAIAALGEDPRPARSRRLVGFQGSAGFAWAACASSIASNRTGS